LSLNYVAMDYLEVIKVKAAWGDKLCDHPHLEKEYYTGAFLTNYVCTQCGKEFTIPEKMELYQERQRAAKKLKSA
jgi:hypothetical protein